MKRSLLLLACALPVLPACTSRPMKQVEPAASSRPIASATSVEPRLQKIKEEYHLIGLWFTNNQVTVCTGMLTSEQMKSLQGAIHAVVGHDVEVFTIIK